jgi:hypothetical protein
VSNSFYVKDVNGNLVAATFLQVNGAYVLDPNTQTAASTPIFDANGNPISGANPNSYLIVPVNYSIQNATAFAQQVQNQLSLDNSASEPGTSGLLTAYGMMADAFNTGGPQDLQRTYNGTSGAAVPAFTDAASFNLGYVAAYSGVSETAALIGGGALNEAKSIGQQLGLVYNAKPIDVSGTDDNTYANVNSIDAGAALAAGMPGSDVTESTANGVTTYNYAIGPINNFDLSQNFANAFISQNSASALSVPDGGTQYTNQNGVTLTVYANGTDIITPEGQDVTVDEDVWDLPVATPTVVVSELSNNILLNESGGANVTPTQNGEINISNSSISIFGPSAVGSGIPVALNGNEDAISISGNGAVGLPVSVTGNNNSISGAAGVVNDTSEPVQISVAINGTGDTVNLSNVAFTFAAGSQATVIGQGDIFSLGFNSSVSLAASSSGGPSTSISTDGSGNTTFEFVGGSVLLGPIGQVITETSGGALSVAVGANGTAQVALSAGDSTGSPIQFSGIESMALNLDGSYSLVDQSGNAYTLSPLSGSSNYVLSNSSGTVDVTLDASSLSSVSLGQSLSIQTVSGATLDIPVWGGSSVIGLSNLGDTSVSQGSAITIDANTVDISAPGSGTTQQYSFASDGTVSSVATFDDSSAQTSPLTVASYDSSGDLTQLLSNNSDGTSQIQSWSSEDPSAGYISQTENFSGSDGTGSLVNATTDFTSGLSEIDQYNSAPGVVVTKTVYSGPDGTGAVLSTTTNNTDGTSTVTTYSSDDDGVSSSGITAVSTTYSGWDGTGSVQNTVYSTPTNGNISDAEIGDVLGSTIGKFLGGNSAVESIGLSTVLGGIGEDIGQTIDLEDANGGSAGDISGQIETLADSALPDVLTVGAGAVGAYLTGELVKDLGITGLPAEIIDTGAGFVVSTIATNLTEDALGESVAWDAGLSATSFVGAFSGFAAVEIATLTISWSTPQQENIADIGASVGAAIGSLFGPLGSFAGGFIGDILGGIIGAIFGSGQPADPYAQGTLVINSSSSSPYSYQLTHVQDNGPASYLNSLGTLVASELNQIVSQTGATISNAFLISGKTELLVDAQDQVLQYFDNSAVAYTHNGGLGNYAITDVSDFVTDAVLEQLADISFSGGDQYVEKAIESTVSEWEAATVAAASNTPVGQQPPVQSAITLNTLVGNIQIADDYEKYLQNENTINALIAESPTSNFAAGWIIELEEAASLGLNNLDAGVQGQEMWPTNTLKIYGGTEQNLTPDEIAQRVDSSLLQQVNVGSESAELDGSNIGITLSRDSLPMTVNGNNNRVEISGNSESFTLNGTGNIFVEDGDGSSVLVNGDSSSVNMYGNNNSATVNGQYANISISGLNFSLTNANGDVTIADDSSATVNGVNEGINLANGNAVTVNGGDMVVNIGGDNNSIIANGDDEQFSVAGNGNAVTGNGQGDAFDLGGSNETITLGSGQVSMVDGIAASVSGENFGVNVGNQDQLTLNGQSSGVDINGNGDTVTLNGTSLGISGNSSSGNLTLNGSGDSINVTGSSNVLTANGGEDYLTASGNDNDLVANGQQSTVTVSGGNESAAISNGTATFLDNSTGSVSGVADTINLYNSSQLTINGGSMAMSADGGENTVTLNGDDEGVNVQGTSNVVTDNGSYNTVTVDGDSDNITQNGSGEWVTVNGSYDAVQGQLDGSTVTINGTGGAITTTGSNDLLIENGTNDYLTVTGSDNNLVANGDQITASLSGANDGISIADGTVSLADNAQVTVDGASDQINIRNTSQITVNGGSMSLAVNGGQDTVTTNGNVESFDLEGSGNLITGNGSSDSLSANGDNNDMTLNGDGETAYVSGTENVLAVNGQGNQVTFAGSNNTLHASGAVAYVLDNSSADFEGGGDSITVFNNDVVTANGSGFTFVETSTNSTLTANGDYNTVTIGGNTNAVTLNGDGASVSVSGSLNSVSVSGQDAVLQVGGVQQTLALNQGSIALDTGSQANLVGNGNMVTLGASDSLTVNGSNNWVNDAADSTITLMGDGNGVGGSASSVTAVLEGDGQYAILSNDAVTVGAGVQVGLTGDGNTVSVGANATLDLTGDGNAIQMSGATLVLADSGTSAGSDPETGSSESGFQINGFDFSSYNAGEFSSAAGAQSIQSLASTGANSVSLVVTQYVQNVSDINIEPTSATESDASIEQAISEAQAQGLSVTLDPHLDIADGTWRAYLDPSNVAQFFANYQAMIVHYAEIAQATGVGMLVIGTEMESLSGSAYESYWDTLIAAVRQVYSGQLTYASGWNETANVSFWDKLDVIGADAYIPVTSETDPTLSQLESGWTTVSSDSYAASVMNNMSPLAFYESMSAEYDKPLLFTEIGYQSVNDTNQLEGAFGTSNWVDFQQQSQALQAFFSTFSQNGGNWFEGAYLWNWEANPAGVEAGDFSVQGKPGLNIVDYWFGLQTGSQSGTAIPNTVNGDSNSLTIGNGDALNVVGNSNAISLGGDSAVNVSGQGNTVAVAGGNNVIQTTGATTINLSGNSATVITDGDGDSISASGSQDGLAVNSNNSTIALSGTADALTLSGNDSTIDVTGANDTLSISGTGNTVNVSGGSAVIQTNGTNAIELLGDASSASVDGGSDTIDVNGTNDSLSVIGTGATIGVGDGGSSISLDSGDYQVTAGNGNNSITAGDGSDSISVGSGTNTIEIGNGNDTISLGDGTDVLTLGSGDDAITLGDGNDTVTLGGDDALTINVAAGDSTNTASALISSGSSVSSQSNELIFAAANSDQLWFSRSNNDLLISVIGTSSQIDIAGWFDGNSPAVQSFAAADGKLLTSDDVNALVEAMASFSPPAAGSTALPASYQNQLESVIAANWH